MCLRLCIDRLRVFTLSGECAREYVLPEVCFCGTAENKSSFRIRRTKVKINEHSHMNKCLRIFVEIPPRQWFGIPRSETDTFVAHQSEDTTGKTRIFGYLAISFGPAFNRFVDWPTETAFCPIWCRRVFLARLFALLSVFVYAHKTNSQTKTPRTFRFVYFRNLMSATESPSVCVCFCAAFENRYFPVPHLSAKWMNLLG